MPQQEIHPTRRYKRVIQLELNELSREVIDALVAQDKLPNFKRINKEWAFMRTESEKEYQFLEPWIQWCTVHTGRTYDEHKIFRLSDVHKLEHTQIWEALSANGIESGIIGSMNCIRRHTNGGIFFPDPWAQVNETYPENLKPLWDLIASRVQGHATSAITVGDMIKALRICMTFNLPWSIYFKMGWQLVRQKLNKKSKWRLAGVFDLLLAEIFKSVLKKTNYGYYTLFLNCVAHYQHHYWRAFDGKSFDPSIRYDDINVMDDPMTFGYEMYDRILGDVIDIVNRDPETLVIILSGLSQIPYTDKEEQGGMNYYRLNDHKAFAASVGLSECEIFPMMSRDWQLKYPNGAAREKALDVLGSMKVDGYPVFKLSENTEGYIFIETDYTRGAKADSVIVGRNNETICKFYDVFTNTAIKSGHHSGIGLLWVSDKGVASADGVKVPLTSVYNFTVESLTEKKAVTA